MHWNICLHRKRNTKKCTWRAKILWKVWREDLWKVWGQTVPAVSSPGNTHSTKPVPRAIYLHFIPLSQQLSGGLGDRTKELLSSPLSQQHPPSFLGSSSRVNPPAGRRRKLHTLLPSSVPAVWLLLPPSPFRSNHMTNPSAILPGELAWDCLSLPGILASFPFTAEFLTTKNVKISFFFSRFLFCLQTFA